MNRSMKKALEIFQGRIVIQVRRQAPESTSLYDNYVAHSLRRGNGDRTDAVRLGYGHKEMVGKENPEVKLPWSLLA